MDAIMIPSDEPRSPHAEPAPPASSAPRAPRPDVAAPAPSLTPPTSRSSRPRACAGSTSSARARSTAPGWRSTSTSTRSTTRTSSRATSARRSTSTTSYLFVVLHFPVYDKRVNRLNAAEVDIFVGPDFVITLPNEALQPLQYLFDRCRTSEDVREHLFSKGAGLPALQDRRRLRGRLVPDAAQDGDQARAPGAGDLRGEPNGDRARPLQRQAGDHQLPQDRPPAARRAEGPRAHQALRHRRRSTSTSTTSTTRRSASGTCSRTSRRSSRGSSPPTRRCSRHRLNDSSAC